MNSKVTVFCASSDGVDEKYFTDARAFGKILAKNNFTLVYGGGTTGLMGAVADSALAAGGRVVGVIPLFMKEIEWDHKGVTELIIVETMAERKELMYFDTDAVVALPGGVGTLEEVTEVLSMKRLGKYAGVVVFLNTDGYYDPLIQMLNRSIDERFMNEQHRKLWEEVRKPEEILPAILKTPLWDETAIEYAVVKKQPDASLNRE